MASSSPRRRRLLEQVGVPFEVDDPGEVETASGRPKEQAVGNAVAKARKIAEQRGEGLVVGADTVVVFKGKVFGKPEDTRDAKAMLRTLSGKVHTVITGLAVVDAASGRVETDFVETLVHMRLLSDEEIAAYVATGEPFGKAGGYAIQGVGGLIVEEIRGCFYNVVGLPLSRLDSLLRGFGVQLLKGPKEDRTHPEPV